MLKFCLKIAWTQIVHMTQWKFFMDPQQIPAHLESIAICLQDKK
jgi:hypothetical protein